MKKEEYQLIIDPVTEQSYEAEATFGDNRSSN